MILTREIMGVLTLAILWINTLLIAAAALKQAGELWRRGRKLRALRPGQEGEGLIEGRVEEGRGEGGAIAGYEIEQIGRAGAERAGRRAIHFSDRTFSGETFGGEITSGATRIHVPAGEAEVWPERESVLRAAACEDAGAFERVMTDARKARGHVRKVRVFLGAGSPVWIGGSARSSDKGLEMSPGSDAPLLVSAIDPRAWIRGRVALGVLFAVSEIAIAGGVSWLVLVRPIFDGWQSKLGGALGLAFFLGVQPLGALVRDALRPPSRAFVRNIWLEPRR